MSNEEIFQTMKDLVSEQFGMELDEVTLENTTPFGGYKLSGFGGKDKGRESHDQYTETKTIFLNLDR